MLFPAPATCGKAAVLASVTLVSVLSGPASARAATVTAKPGGLAAALSAAGAGGRVELLAGTYTDAVTVPSLDADVTVVPAPGATPILKNVALRGGRHLRLDGLRIQGLTVRDTDDLTVANSDLSVGGTIFEFTDRLTITGNRIHDAWDGLVVDDASDVTITANECWAVPVTSRTSGGDCAQLARLSRFTIARNVFRDQPAKPHADAIEITDTNRDGLIARNTFRNVRGLILTPGSTNPSAAQWRITIVNNLFSRTRTFAIQAQRMQDSRFLHNTAPDGGTVGLSGASAGNAMVGNIFKSLTIDVSRAATFLPVEDYNLITTVPSGYRRGAHDLTGTATFVDPAAGDYHLAPGSKGIGAGSLEWMPADDLLGVTRTAPDLGALAYAG